MTIKEFKRFFEPVKTQKGLTVLFVLFSAYVSFFWIFSVEIIKKITESIENQNLDEVYKLTYFFIVFIIFSQIIRWFWKDIFPIFLKNTKIAIQEKYIKKFILFDNNSYEKIWTWKLIALIERWIDSWGWLLTEFLFFWLQNIFSFIFAVFYIYLIIWNVTLYIILFILFLLFLFSF